jgi:hypothetical protein
MRECQGQRVLDRAPLGIQSGQSKIRPNNAQDQLRPAAHVQLPIQPLEMGVDRMPRDPNFGCDALFFFVVKNA